MGWPREEKRNVKRILYVRPIGYRAMGGQPSHGEILDIGDGGVRIRTAVRPPKKGTAVQVRIPLIELQITVPALGQVRWVKQEGAEVYEMGLLYIL
jgi:PilZ domain